MKKVLCTLLTLISTTVCFTQTKFEYCDIYARGNWYNMTITIIQKDKIENLEGNIGTVLNKMADQGWELDESIVIPRHGAIFTRHKVHFIMKKAVTVNDSIQNIIPSTRLVVNSNNNQTLDTSLMVEFNNVTNSNLDKSATKTKVEEFINEIASDLKNVNTNEELLIIDKKIKALDSYSKSLPKKDFSIIDKVSSFKYNIKRKAKKMGVNIP